MLPYPPPIHAVESAELKDMRRSTLELRVIGIRYSALERTNQTLNGVGLSWT